MTRLRRCCGVCACLALAFGCARAETRALPNLVYNPSFEQALLAPQSDRAAMARGEYPRAILHWQDRANMRLDTTAPHSGGASVRVTGPSDGYTFHTPTGSAGVALVPGTSYVLSAWVRTTATKGKGASVSFGQTQPAGQALGQSSWVKDAKEWTRAEARLATPANHVRGWLRLHWDLKDGETAWFDDVSLVPADGKVPTAPAPTIGPAGGTFGGPIHVTLASALPGSEIRYTIDGGEPTPSSTRYTVPFRLAGHAEVRARVFHAGHRTSDAAKATFALKAKTDGGVPFHPIGYGHDVGEWWAGHIHNPKSPSRVGEVKSPKPVINVADVRDKHPSSTTGGIEEALAALPKEGGSLWFPKDRGPYVILKKPDAAKNYYGLASPLLVLRRSNLHFLSDGAIIQFKADWGDETVPSGNVAALFTFCSMDYADRRAMEQPSTNFYFKGITFDGGGAAPGATVFRHCSDILFDRCVFRNFNPKAPGHPGCISAASVVDNLWCRGCRFEGGKFGIYYDGVHNAGFVDCFFGPALAQAAVLMMTNNDMAPLSAAQRTCQYIVIAGCTFEGGGGAALQVTNANTLVAENTARGPFRIFASQTGRGRSNILLDLRYDGAGIQLVGNRVEQCGTFLELRGDCAQHTRKALRMASIVRGNVVGKTDCFLVWAPEADPHLPPYAELRDLTLEGNEFAGARLPQARLPREASDRMGGIRIAGNRLRGAARPLVVDAKGQPLVVKGVAVGENRIEAP